KAWGTLASGFRRLCLVPNISASAERASREPVSTDRRARRRNAIGIRAMVFLMSAAVVLPVLAVSLYAIERSARHAEALEREILLDSANARTQVVDTFLRQVQATLQALAE